MELRGSNIIYSTVNTLGQGSFGVTYKAIGSTIVKGAFGEMKVDLPHPVAIKEFFMRDINQRSEDGSIIGLTEGGMAWNYAQKFRKEAERLAEMNHPNIVKVLDFIEANNTFYYVMEFIDGEDINHYMHGKPLSEAEATSIIKEVAKAVGYMHDKHQMLHLDLKPGNVMRRKSDGHIFLIDFGLSKHYSDEGQPDTSTTIGLGTEGYAPLEQGKRSSATNTFLPTIDVYALGATYFKMLTGETPPAASDLLDDEDLLPDSMTKHRVSEAVQSVVVRAMIPSAKKRTSSVQDFLSELDSIEIENDATLSTKDEAPTIIDPIPEVNAPNQQCEEIVHSDEQSKEEPQAPGIDIDKNRVVMADEDETIYAEPTRFEQVSSDEWIDLGVSVLWHDCNLCAKNFLEFGTLTDFGRVSSISHFNIDEDTEANMVWKMLPNNISGTEYDTATEILSSDSRIPTRREWKELMDKCHWVWSEICGVRGYRVIGRNGNSIFLPATGKRNSGGVSSKNLMGYYWSSEKSSLYKCSYYLKFDAEDFNLYYEPFNTQRAIRPVKNK